MADHNSLISAAVLCFAILGFIDVLMFVLKRTSDNIMSLIRRLREHYLELRSWRVDTPKLAVPPESSAEPQINLKMLQPKT
jgi:hypothetical protein